MLEGNILKSYLDIILVLKVYYSSFVIGKTILNYAHITGINV